MLDSGFSKIIASIDDHPKVVHLILLGIIVIGMIVGLLGFYFYDKTMNVFVQSIENQHGGEMNALKDKHSSEMTRVNADMDAFDRRINSIEKNNVLILRLVRDLEPKLITLTHRIDIVANYPGTSTAHSSELADISTALANMLDEVRYTSGVMSDLLSARPASSTLRITSTISVSLSYGVQIELY